MRVQIKPIEIWAHENSDKLHELRIHRHNENVRWWREVYETTPNDEWWNGYWWGSGIMVAIAVIYALISKWWKL